MKNKRIVAAAVALLGVLALTASVFAGTPFRKPVTMTAGSGSLVYSNGIANQVFYTYKDNAVIFGSGVATATVSVTSGSVTNQLGTKAITASDKGYLITNDTWHFQGDKLLLSSTDTNTHTAYVVGEEQ